MLKSIRLNLDTMESMLYYWKATSEKEKVGESYLSTISDQPGMNSLYEDGFDQNSVRKVLSAISNREPLNEATKLERKFWNNNMWMLEDLEMTDSMMQPVKVLNLDDLKAELNSKHEDTRYEDVEIIFVPGLNDEYKIEGDKLIINFFRIVPDLYGTGEVKVGEMEIKKYIGSKLGELL